LLKTGCANLSMKRNVFKSKFGSPRNTLSSQIWCALARKQKRSTKNIFVESKKNVS
jgi:hypothetical protein